MQDCQARIDERGDELGEVHIDPGRSAWNPRVRRPGWDRLMERLESGATGGVIVFDLARFSRRPIEGERLIAAAERGLVILDSEGEYDLLTASGRKHFRDQLNAAAYESDRLSTRVRRGKKLKAMRGESNGTHRAFGFEPDGSVRESEAAILRELAERFLAGESQDALIRDLNQRGITTSTGRGWTHVLLRQVMKRPRNAGLVEYKGAVVSKLPGDPIWDERTYERVMALYASRRRGRPVSDAYLCSGILRCGRCGTPLSGRPRTVRPYSDGEPRRQYFCQPRAGGPGCGGIAADQRAVDEAIRDLVVAILSDPRHAAAVEAAARAATDVLAAVDAEIAELENLATELSDRLGRREITLARYDAATKPLDRDLAKLRAKRVELETRPADVVPPEEVAASRDAWLRRWSMATTPERRTLIRQALRHRHLVLKPADRHGPPRFDRGRIVIGKLDSDD